jgi:cyclohexadienyl dehydratase
MIARLLAGLFAVLLLNFAAYAEEPARFSRLDDIIRRGKAFVDQWLHIAMEDGSFGKIYDTWFD